jgi:hypothetical protein
MRGRYEMTRKIRKIRNEAQLMYGIQIIWRSGNGRLSAGWAYETIHDAGGRIIGYPYIFSPDPDDLEIVAEKWRKVGNKQILKVEIVSVTIPAVPASLPTLNAYSEGEIKTLSPMLGSK